MTFNCCSAWLARCFSWWTSCWVCFNCSSNCLILVNKIASFLDGFSSLLAVSANGWLVFGWSEFLLGLSRKNFSGVLGETLLVNTPRVFLVNFGTNKELSSRAGFLCKITGLQPIKTGTGLFGTWGKFSVIGGFFFSNHFLPAKMEPISPSSFPW